MHDHSRVITTTSSPASVTTCPTFVTRPLTAVCPSVAGTSVVSPLVQQVAPTAVTTTPTAAVTPTATDQMLNALLQQLGLSNLATTPTAAAVSPLATGIAPLSAPGQIFSNPLAQLGGVSPFAALAASNPSAALAALSPALNIFNPAINPNAALLQFNPSSAPTLALSGKQGKATLPFGKLNPFAKSSIGKLGKGKGKTPFWGV